MASGRYLILRLSALGDVVFALEALAALKAAEPGAAVDWVVEDRAEGLLEDHPWVDRVLVYPRKELSRALPRPWLWPSLAARLFGWFRELRSQRYDAALDLHGNFKSGLHLLVVRARRKLGFANARELAWLAANERVAIDDATLHRAERGLALIGALLGRAAPAGPEPLIPSRPDARRMAAEFLARHPAGTSGATVCVAPGSSGFAAFKRWPAVRHRELVAALDHDGVRVVLCTGPGESDLARAILDGKRVHWCDGGQLGLQTYLEVLRLADAVVAADSGPLHMAQAVGTPAVALFGPKDPAIYGPRRPGSIVLRYPVACAPCGRRDCDAPLCVQGIPVEGVRRAVHELLESRR